MNETSDLNSANKRNFATRNDSTNNNKGNANIGHEFNATVEGKEAHSTQNVDASFNDTYNSLESLLQSKLAKLDAIKSLVSAEANLSLSAIFALVFVWAGLALVSLTVWLLINVAIGLAVYEMVDSLWMIISSLTIVNILCAIALFNYIKHLTSLVGFPNTIGMFKKEGA